MNWRYDRGQHRHKHRWKFDYAEFQPSRKGYVGKCPKHITRELAEKIVNSGVPVYEVEGSPYPERIYAVYQGTIYEAVPTVPGKSYHGYPWRGDLPGRTPPPRRVFRELEQNAKNDGTLEEYKRWLKKFGGSE